MESFYGPPSTKLRVEAVLSVEELAQEPLGLGPASTRAAMSASSHDAPPPRPPGLPPPTTLALAQMAVEPVAPPPRGAEIVFHQHEIAAKDRTAPMNHTRANVWLKKFRENTDNDKEVLDLTDRPEFDWRGYIAHHKHAADIVGPGITGFAFLTLVDTRDPSVKSVRPRNDFMALRADGSAVRLHPHKGNNPAAATPIHGFTADWVKSSPDEPAQTPSFHAGISITKEHLGLIARMDLIPQSIPQTQRDRGSESAGLAEWSGRRGPGLEMVALFGQFHARHLGHHLG